MQWSSSVIVGHADSLQTVHIGNVQCAPYQYMGQQGQRAPARITSDDIGDFRQFQSGSGTLVSTKSNQQTSSSNMHDQTQADVGFRPQYGRGGVTRATGPQQGSVGASPKLPWGLPVGANSSAAR